MTALSEYQRLEAQGLYYPAPGAQRQDVILSLGDATLTIANHRDVALAHWSLAALERENPGRRPAVYAPGADAEERLELDDETMIRAIERVRRAVLRATPRPGRYRRRLRLAALAAAAIAAAVWLPDALIRYAASLVPQATRAVVGQEMLANLTRVTGPPCASPEGTRALDALLARLGDTALPRAFVLPDGVRASVHLPGGTALLSRAVVEDHESPRVVAGYLLAEAERARTADPVLALLETAGLGATLRLLATGRIAPEALAAHAETLLTAPAAPVAPAPLLARFEAAGVPVTPYAYAVDISGEETLALIEAEPVPAEAAAPLLSDDQWVALRDICEG